MRIPFISLAAAGALALGGCAYGDFGYGGGYGGVSLGYGDYGYGPYGYGSPYYGAGYGYGSPYFGWYDDYYYPGSGVYVYDSYRRPHMWSDRQRTYWMSRRQTAVATSQTRTLRTNWSGFNRRTASDTNHQWHTRTH